MAASGAGGPGRRAWGAAGGCENRILARNVGYFCRVGIRVRVCGPKSVRPDPALLQVQGRPAIRTKSGLGPPWGPGITGRGLAFPVFVFFSKKNTFLGETPRKCRDLPPGSRTAPPTLAAAVERSRAQQSKAERQRQHHSRSKSKIRSTRLARPKGIERRGRCSNGGGGKEPVRALTAKALTAKALTSKALTAKALNAKASTAKALTAKALHGSQLFWPSRWQCSA